MNTSRNRRSVITPAYYLGRPAATWHAAIGRRRPATDGGRLARARSIGLAEGAV
jgi:hypothetical protein